jgi:Protein of unknown function (DUF1367)
MKLSLIKTLSGLKPAYDSDGETYKKIPLNDILEYEVKIVRNYKFHKKYFALIELVFENQERYTNIDHLRKAIQIEAGYYTERASLQGEVIIEADSISFAKMDNVEFDKLYNSCIDVIIKYFQFDRKEIESEILNFY